MSTITAHVQGNHLVVVCPYDAAWQASARDLGGRWDRDLKAWRFDVRDTERVHAALAQIYGWSPQASGATTSIRLTLPATAASEAEYRLLGQRLAWRPTRDEPVRLAAGVVLAAGRWAPSGGSVRRPALGDVTGVELDVRDIPVEQLAHLDRTGVTYRVAEETQRVTDALLAERQALTQRLREIDEQLAQLNHQDPGAP